MIGSGCILLLSLFFSEPGTKALNLENRVSVFEQYHEGEPSGSMRLSVEQQGSNWVVKDRTEVPRSAFEESLETVIDSNGALQEHKMTGSVGLQTFEVHVRLEQGRILGTARSPGKEQETKVDLTAPKGTMERTALFAMIPFFEWSADTEFEVTIFNGFDLGLQTLSLEVTGEERIQVIAGEFDVWRIAVRGGNPEQVFFVTKKPPFRTVRIDVPNTPWHYELQPELPRQPPIPALPPQRLR